MNFLRKLAQRRPARLSGLQRHMAVEEAATFRHDLDNYLQMPLAYLQVAFIRHPLANEERFKEMAKLNAQIRQEMFLIQAAKNAVQIMTPRTHEYIRNTIRPRVRRMQELIDQLNRVEAEMADAKGISQEERNKNNYFSALMDENVADLVEHNLIRYMAPYEGDTRFSLNHLLTSLKPQKDAHFKIELPKSDIHFKGNRMGLFQALNEIILNADQHPVQKPGGHDKLPVHKTLSLEEFEDEQGRWARIKIADNAKGIPPKQLYKIDQEHYENLPPHVRMDIPADQVYRIFDAGVSHRTQGTGLGLSVAHKTVRSHSGRIRVQSTPGSAGNPDRGTTFIIDLPLKRRPAWQVWLSRAKAALSRHKPA